VDVYLRGEGATLTAPWKGGNVRLHHEDLMNRRDELLVKLLEALRRSVALMAAEKKEEGSKQIGDLLYIIQIVNAIQ